MSDQLTLVARDELPDPQKAPLPIVYQDAVNALQQCERIDECKTWADKAMALASYARQADDETLYKTAIRIQDRAVRRSGELLEEISPFPGARTDLEPSGGTPTKLTRTDAAREAGLSKDQQMTAIRVARVPAAEFEAAIESDDPPTVTELAQRGTRPSPAHQAALDQLAGRDPADFKAATTFMGIAREFLLRSGNVDLVAANRGLNAEERAKLIVDYTRCVEWITAALEAMNGV